MASIRDVFDLVDQHPELSRALGPTSEASIRLGERRLGVEFPPSYRMFVSRFGCLIFGGMEFYGITKTDMLEVPNVVWVTLEERQHGLPTSMIEVADPGIGNKIFCIDTSRVESDGESPIVEWVPGAFAAAQNLAPIFPGFAEFAVENLTGELKMQNEEEGS